MTRGGYYVLETTVYIALLLVDNYSKIMHYYGRVRCGALKKRCSCFPLSTTLWPVELGWRRKCLERTLCISSRSDFRCPNGSWCAAHRLFSKYLCTETTCFSPIFFTLAFKFIPSFLSRKWHDNWWCHIEDMNRYWPFISDQVCFKFNLNQSFLLFLTTCPRTIILLLLW